MLGQRIRVYSTEAIAFKRMDYGEADRIVTLFTPRFGKLRVLAKGVRRPTSRLAGHLELFAHSHVMLARGRELDIVTQASTIDPFREVREDLARSSYAFHLAELVDAFLEERDSHPGVFTLLADALRALDRGVPALDVVARHFEMHLLAAAGYRPELTVCLRCRTPIQAQPNWYSVTIGGVLCPHCGPSEPSASPIGVAVLKALRYLQRTAEPASLTVRIPRAVREEVERLLRRQIEFDLERRLRATDFIHRVAVNGVADR